MSWAMLYANQKYDMYVVARESMFQIILHGGTELAGK